MYISPYFKMEQCSSTLGNDLEKCGAVLLKQSHNNHLNTWVIFWMKWNLSTRSFDCLEVDLNLKTRDLLTRLVWICLMVNEIDPDIDPVIGQKWVENWIVNIGPWKCGWLGWKLKQVVDLKSKLAYKDLTDIKHAETIKKWYFLDILAPYVLGEASESGPQTQVINFSAFTASSFSSG